MRPDNRAADAIRPVLIERNYTKYAEGAVLVSFGDTRVVCTATVVEQVPAFVRDTGRGWITAEYAILPRAVTERVPRDTARKRRSIEISRLIGRVLRSAVDLEKLGEYQIILDCDVIQADGGTRTAAITGAFVALHDAVRGLMESAESAELPVQYQCAAVSVGIVDGEIRLDLVYEEDAAAEVDLNLAMLSSGEIVEVQACAENKPFSRDDLNAMLDLGARGIRQLFALQKEVLSRE